MMLPATITFEDTSLTIIDREGMPWLTQTDLAGALYGIKGGGQDGPTLEGAIRQIRRLLDRNRDEFTDEMTAMLTMETAGGPQQVRIFSTRGSHLMGFFAKTDRAKRFRAWVLDVLEGKVALNGSNQSTLAERRVRVMELNAANRAIDNIVKMSGRREALRNMRTVYAKAGLMLDLPQTPPQGELPLDVVDPSAA